MPWKANISWLTGLHGICAALALLVVQPACSPAHNAQPMVNPVTSLSGKVTAQWLRQQPGPRLAGVGLHLLDAGNRPIRGWDSLSANLASSAASRSPEIILEASNGAPADIYLYVDYDPTALALDTVELATGRDAEYLLLTIAHREPGVLAVALARIGAREAACATPAGPLACIRFQPGPERVYRSASEVNTDPSSAPVLELATATSGGPLLCWTERNIGDYDNNSVIGAPDITPIAVHYLERPAGAVVPAELELIDGDGNGEINSADLVPIARNFNASIDGFNVCHALGPSPDPDDYTQLAGSPTVSRIAVWDSSDSAARRQALRYEYEPAFAEGDNTFYVKAWSTDGSTGLPSNEVKFHASPSNLPPVWDTTLEITSVAPAASGLRLTFGSATDPEGGEVSYYLRYVQGSAGDLSGPGAQSLVLTEAELDSGPPYIYTLDLAQRSATYTMTLQARDEQGARTEIMQYTSAFLPGLSVSSDPWGYFRADAMRTGCNPAGGPHEPLAVAWQSALGESTASAPVISSDGWAAAGNASGIVRWHLADGADAGSLSGSLTGVPYYLSMDGSHLVGGADSGAQLWWIGLFPGSTALPEAPSGAAPLLLGEYIIIAGNGGSVRAYSTENSALALPAWQQILGIQPADGACLAPASDGATIYIGLTGGKLYMLDALSGEVLDEGDVGVSLAGSSLALDSGNQKLYAASAADSLVEIDAASLVALRRWPLAAGETSQDAPVLVLHTTPPLALCPMEYNDGGGPQGVVQAIDLTAWTEAWRFTAEPGTNLSHLSAGSDSIYINTGAELLVLDHAGRRRQTLTGLPGDADSSPAIDASTLVLINAGNITGLEGTTDTPPEWVGVTGIKALNVDGNDLEVTWDYATDSQGEPVSYAIFYSADSLPAFDPPYSGTTVIHSLPQSGTEHSYTITGLDPGQRYYVGVRAYDGYWDDNPALEENANYLAATPPWQREEVRLGVGLELPDGEVYFLRGLTAPNNSLHLVYSQRTDASLTHAWGTTGSWQHEGPNLNAYTASTFDLAWDGDLVMAWGNAAQFGLLARNGPDAWDATTAPFATLIPPVNPQLAVALDGDPAMVFTEFVDGVFPEINLDYYVIQAASGIWGSAYPLDSLNFSGRDLDLVFDPADATKLWAACQRGYNNTPERATPMQGECVYAWGDGIDGFTLDALDSGDNAPDSDCGKRVQQVLDGSGNPCLAYFDLNSSSAQPLGQLKYATYDGSVWDIETVTTFDLSFQTGSNQFTYGELGFDLDNSGRPVIAYLARQTWASQVNVPHFARCYVWVRELDGAWHSEQLTDGEQVFPRDREPCVLLIPPDGSWHVFYASSQHPDDPQPVADKLVHLWRPAP